MEQSSVGTRATRASLPELVDEFAWVEAGGFGELEKLDNVDPALAAFHFGDEGLMASELGRHVCLVQPRPFPVADEELGQAPMAG